MLIVFLFGVVKASGVLDGHLVAFLRIVDIIARLKDLARNSHGDCYGGLEMSAGWIILDKIYVGLVRVRV